MNVRFLEHHRVVKSLQATRPSERLECPEAAVVRPLLHHFPPLGKMRRPIVGAPIRIAHSIFGSVAASAFFLYFFGIPETRDPAEKGSDQIATAVQNR